MTCLALDMHRSWSSHYAEDGTGHWHGKAGQFAAKGTSDAKAPAPASKKKLTDHLATIGQRLMAAEHGVKEAGNAALSKLPRAVQYAARGAGHALFATYIAAQKAVRAVAEEKGLSPEQVDQVARVTAVADCIGGGKLFPMALAASGLGVFATAGSFVPVGSLGYLAYSTSKDPGATWRAAQKAVQAVRGKKQEGAKHYAEEGEPEAFDLIGELAERAKKLGDGFDAWAACFLAACDEDGDVPGALDVADEAAQEMDGDRQDYAADHAERVATAAERTHTDPSEAQKDAGNYRMGKVTLNGLPITIENPRGSVRSGKDADGKPWSVTMAHHYGYLRRTMSEADADHLDCFIGPDPRSELVFVVDQEKPGGRFDEHKVLLGFRSLAEAKRGYLDCYCAGWKGLGGITSMTLPHFKRWVQDGDTARRVAPQMDYAREMYQSWAESVQYVKDAEGHEHKGKGPGGGQFAKGSGGGGAEAGKANGAAPAEPAVKPAVDDDADLKAAHVKAAAEDYAQNGTKAKAFKEWFGDWEGDPANASKVVNKDGSPMPVFHATTKDFDEFKPKSYGDYGSHPYYYFAQSKGWVNKFVKDEPQEGKTRIISAYLNIRNPLDLRGKILTASGWGKYFESMGAEIPEELQSKIAKNPHLQVGAWQFFRFDNGKLQNELKRIGHDGLVIHDVARGKQDNTVWIAFEPTQIKAVDNAGSFDPSNPSIKYAADDSDLHHYAEPAAPPAVKAPAVPKPTLADRHLHVANAFNAGIDRIHAAMRSGEHTPEQAHEHAQAHLDKMHAATSNHVKRAWRGLKREALAEHGDNEATRSLLGIAKKRLQGAHRDVLSAAVARAEHPRQDADRATRDSGRADVEGAMHVLGHEPNSAREFVRQFAQPQARHLQLQDTLKAAGKLNRKLAAGTPLSAKDQETAKALGDGGRYWTAFPAPDGAFTVTAPDLQAHGEAHRMTPEGAWGIHHQTPEGEWKKGFRPEARGSKQDYSDEGGEGHWVTIGSEQGEDGKKHGGSPAFIKGGKITKGAKPVAGKTVGAIGAKPKKAPASAARSAEHGADAQALVSAGMNPTAVAKMTPQTIDANMRIRGLGKYKPEGSGTPATAEPEQTTTPEKKPVANVNDAWEELADMKAGEHHNELLSGGYMPLGEMADHFGVDKRTAFDLLSKMKNKGVSLYTKDGSLPSPDNAHVDFTGVPARFKEAADQERIDKALPKLKDMLAVDQKRPGVDPRFDMTSIASLRRAMPDLSRADFDEAMHQMRRKGEVELWPLSNHTEMSDADHKASMPGVGEMLAWAKLPNKQDQQAAYGREDEPVLYTAHAPKGGATIAGKAFTGGEFIPASVMARASAAEKAKVEKREPAKAKKSEESKGLVQKISKAKTRAFEGKPVATAKISKQEAGAIGEEIVIAWLKSLGMKDARHLNLDRNNFPIDLVQDHEVIEVKTGQVSNGPKAQQWRLTIGEPGKQEKEWLATAPEEEKAAWNERKQQMIHERKKKALQALQKKLGKPVKARTVTVLLDPGKKTADLFMFDGWHNRIAWGGEDAKKAYQGSVTYE